MSCHSTTRAQEDPYAFTESAPLQANSLAYANHSSAVSNSSSSSSSNNNATTTTTTTTTIQTASSGASLLLTTNSAGSATASKDKSVSNSPTAVTSPATLKVRYNGVVTTASPTATAVVRAPLPVGTTIPVFTKPMQIKQQSQQQGNLTVQSPPTVTVGKLMKKVLPQQKTPMITTVVAGGAKIISRLQQPNQTSIGQQLATTGGSILKFIKIPPQQLAKGAVGSAGGIPQGSFIHVTTSSDGARKLLVTNSSSSNSNGVSPSISVATSTARIANVGTVNTVNRNASGVAVVSNVSTVSPTKIRLIQPQAQGKIYLQATNSGSLGTTTAHLSNPVTIATLRNTLIKQHQLQQQQQQQSPTQQQQKPQQSPQPQQQQHILQQKPPQQHTPSSPKQQQITSQTVQQQQKQQHPQQPQQQKAQQLKQQSIVGNQVSTQPLPHTLPKTSPQNADGTQKPLPKPQLQTCSVQSQSQQQSQTVPKTLLQSTPNGQKQSLLLQQQQQPPSKPAPSPTTQTAAAPAKLQSSQQQPQSLLLQPQRKQQQPTGSSANKQRTVPLQQSPKPAISPAPISLLTSSANATKGGSLLTKVNESSRTSTASPKEENASKMTDGTENVRRSASQQSLLLAGSNVEALTNSPKAHDQSLQVVTEEITRSPSSATPVEPTFASTIVGNKQPVTDAALSSAQMVGERKASEASVTQEAKLATSAMKEEEHTAPENMNGKVRAMSGRKSTVAGKPSGKQQQKSTKRSHSQHMLIEEQEQLQGRASPPVGNIGILPSCTTSTPNVSGKNKPPSPSASLLLFSVKLEKEFDIKQEVVEQDEKPPKQRFVAPATVPGAIAMPIKRPKIKEWHAPGAYLFDLKDPGDESDDEAYNEYPNTLSCWYEESIEITVPESSSSASCWGLNSMHRSSASSSSSARGGKGKAINSRSASSAKFEIRMLSRDERLELKKAYLQRRVVQCRNGLRMRSAAASTAKKRLDSMAMMVAKLDKRRQIELNKASAKATCISESCNKSALVMTSHCYDHITEDPDQCLFQRCTAKFSDNSQCRVPVFDISHELILCKEHAWKHDNHDKMSQEVKQHKKPPASVSLASTASPTAIAGRKKTKPPAIQPPSQVVVRSQKRPKKKKKLTPLQQQMLLHQQQYKQQFSITFPTHLSSQTAGQQQQAKVTAVPPANQPQRKAVLQQQQPQKSLLNASSTNGKVQVQIKQGMMPLQKASIIAHPGQPQQRLHLIDGSENPSKTAACNMSALHTAATQANRTHIPAAVGSNRSAASGFTGTTVYRGQHNTSRMEIVDQLEHDHGQQQKQQQQQQQFYSNGRHASPPNTQELLTICENSSAYASSEDTGVGGLSESELLATQDVIEEIIPFEFSNLLHPNMLSHLPPDALNDLLGLDDVPAEDDTGDSHQSCPREVEDDIERALEHVKSLDDMTVEPSSLLGDFLDNVDDEMLDGSDMCVTTEQMLQASNKTNDIRGMVHT